MGKKNNARDVYRFFLVKPNAVSDPVQTMKRLISLEQIEEVHMTEGEYGYIVKARADYSNSDETKARIRGLNSRFCEVVSYYSIKKR